MKKLSPSRVFGWVVLGLLGAALAQSCSSSSAGSSPNGQNGTGGGIRPDGSDARIDVQLPENGGAGGEATHNPLCGVVSCVPDRVDACAPSNAGSPGEAGRGTGGTSSDGGRGTGTSGAPDAAGGPSGGTSSDGGVAGEAGQGATGNAGGQSGAGGTVGGTAGTGGSGGRGGTGPTGPTVNSCQVRPKNAAPLAQCVPAGPGGPDAPCLTGSDCAPGLACVQEGDAGQCRPYCCDPRSCPDRTHCFERTLFGPTPSLEVPVCVPAVDCGLAEPYPCPEGATCSCPAGLACMVIGPDRTTTCVPPGRGREGQACPCAWGHVCSQVTSRCVKLCQTTVPEADCATGMCQVSSELPPGWGVCVGVQRPDGG